MKRTRQWGQILQGIGLGLILGAVSQLFRQHPQSGGILLAIAVVCLYIGLYLMRR